MPFSWSTWASVLNSLTTVGSQRSYQHAIDQFIDWCCSEPRLSFNRVVVLRHRVHLERRPYTPSTINLHLAAVRRLAYEAADTGLLSPELAAGIRRVKGVRRRGVKLGNWLTVEQGKRLLESPQGNTLRGKRDRAVLAVLLGCGLRRAEAIGLALETIQLREDHRVIADLIGKGGHVRTVPMPNWVKAAIDSWTTDAQIKEGRIFRSINRAGRVWGEGVTPKVIWQVVKTAAPQAEIRVLANYRSVDSPSSGRRMRCQARTCKNKFHIRFRGLSH